MYHNSRCVDSSHLVVIQKNPYKNKRDRRDPQGPRDPPPTHLADVAPSREGEEEDSVPALCPYDADRVSQGPLPALTASAAASSAFKASAISLAQAALLSDAWAGGDVMWCCHRVAVACYVSRC